MYLVNGCYLEVEAVNVGRQAVVGDQQQMVRVQLGGLVQKVAGGHVGQRAPHAAARADAHGAQAAAADAPRAAQRAAAAYHHTANAVRRLEYVKEPSSPT